MKKVVKQYVVPVPPQFEWLKFLLGDCVYTAPTVGDIPTVLGRSLRQKFGMTISGNESDAKDIMIVGAVGNVSISTHIAFVDARRDDVAYLWREENGIVVLDTMNSAAANCPTLLQSVSQNFLSRSIWDRMTLKLLAVEEFDDGSKRFCVGSTCEVDNLSVLEDDGRWKIFPMCRPEGCTWTSRVEAVMQRYGI